MSRHLESWREEGRTDPVDISRVDLDAHVAVVHLDHREGSFSGADVALAREWGHGNGVPLLKQRHVVA